MSVSELTITSDLFLDLTTIIYGESGSGKSFIITDILHALKPHVDQICVISPTDRQNHSYDCGIVPRPFIHYQITNDLLRPLWERQEALTAVHHKSNNYQILRALFEKIPPEQRSQAMKFLTILFEKQAEGISSINKSSAADSVKKSQIDNLKEECEKTKIKIYKKVIEANQNYLERCNLNENEVFALKYHSMNPRIVLIFDDCTDQIKKFNNNTIMQRIFYQGRHNFITAIIATHTDKALDAELKKNARVSIFTGYNTATAYFTRPSTSLDKEEQQRAISAAKAAFNEHAPHQKLAFIRLEKKYYRFTATRRKDFKFCSEVITMYAAKVQSDSQQISTTNSFISDFMK